MQKKENMGANCDALKKRCIDKYYHGHVFPLKYLHFSSNATNSIVNNLLAANVSACIPGLNYDSLYHLLQYLPFSSIINLGRSCRILYCFVSSKSVIQKLRKRPGLVITGSCITSIFGFIPTSAIKDTYIGVAS